MTRAILLEHFKNGICVYNMKFESNCALTKLGQVHSYRKEVFHNERTKLKM